MADAVSKLYAEIGFKVNQDGLKQLQSILKDFASQMDKINKATKETAKSFGIFSKEKEKQAIADEKLATQKAKTEEVRIRQGLKIRNQEFKEKMALQKAELSEKRKEEREKEKLARDEERRNEKSNRERKRALRGALEATKDFALGIRRYLKVGGLGISRLLYSGVKESLGRSIATRDFMMMTGAELGDIQSVMGRFASVGHIVPQETIMGDLIKLSQNIADIALGNNDAATFKLLGQAAERGDIAGMLKGIGRAGKYIDNDMFTRLIGNIGLPSYWLSFFKGQGYGKGITNFIDKEGNEKIVEARSALASLTISFKNLSDWLTATLSPALVSASQRFQEWNESVSKSLKGELGQKLSALVEKITDALLGLFTKITPENLYNWVVSFVGSIRYLSNKVIEIAKSLGYVPEGEREQYMKDYSEKIRGRMMSGDIQDWLIHRKAISIGYKPQNSINPLMGNINDNRHQELTIYTSGGDIIGKEAEAFDSMGRTEAPSTAWVNGGIVK